MKKIMFVIPQLAGGGAERVTAVLASRISRMGGYEVHMVVYTRDPRQDYPVDGGIIWHTLDRGPSGIRRLVQKVGFFRETIRSTAPDCVVSLAGAGAAALLVLAVRGTGVPLILSERNDPASDPKGLPLRLLRRWAYGCCDGIVFQTHEAMEFFPGRIRRKGCVICNPLAHALPPRHIGKREKRIVTCCRLNVQKNLDLMIDAFSDIARRFGDHSLEIYGEGEERPRLEEKIRAMGLEGRVILRGYSNHIYDEIRKAAMFVLSSDYEGISNAMLEAIALGVPTVCTDCPAGGARETIRHGVNGLLVPVRDREKLACAMERILEDGEFAEKLSREGEKLRGSISVEAIADQWLAFMEQVERKQ